MIIGTDVPNRNFLTFQKGNDSMSNTEKELQELSRQIKKLEEKINLILKHLKIPLPPKKTGRAGTW